MDLNKAVELFEDLRTKISEDETYLSTNEYRTRVVLIDPVLRMFGWNVEDSSVVQLEYEAGGGRADYALMGKVGAPALAVVEAKRLGSTIGDNEVMQALNYANSLGVKYMIITNGDTWAMYDVFRQAPLGDRRILNLKVSSDETAHSVLSALALWRSNLGSGSSLASDLVTSVFAQTESGHTSAKVAETPDNDWISLDHVDFQNGSNPPRRIKLGGMGAEPADIDAWIDVWVSVAEWLAGTKTRSQWTQVIPSLPASSVKINESIFWGGKASHQLPNGMWINIGLNVRNIGRFTKALVGQLGVELTNVKVSYDASKD